MKILVLINRFPPHHLGGYELRFMDLSRSLRERGHRVSVVTSTWGVPGPTRDPGGVRRILSLREEVLGLTGIAGLAALSVGDARRLRRALREERPDVVLIGNFLELSSALWTVLRASGTPLVLDVSNEWLLDLALTHGNWFRIWERKSRNRAVGLAKKVLRAVLDALPGRALRTSFPGIGAARVYTTARHLAETLRERTGGLLPPVAVVPSGIMLDAFPFRPSHRPVARLLYVGRLKPIKGVHRVIEALGRLDGSFTLTVVGVLDDPGYAERLEEMAGAAEAAGRVEFRAPVSRGDLPDLFAEHDILVFPSEYEEPFSRLILEAMACGLSLVATPSGGTKEAVEDEETGLLFPAGRADLLAAAVSRIASDGELRRGMVVRARALVERRYGIERPVERIEEILREAVG